MEVGLTVAGGGGIVGRPLGGQVLSLGGRAARGQLLLLDHGVVWSGCVAQGGRGGRREGHKRVKDKRDVIGPV